MYGGYDSAVVTVEEALLKCGHLVYFYFYYYQNGTAKNCIGKIKYFYIPIITHETSIICYTTNFVLDNREFDVSLLSFILYYFSFKLNSFRKYFLQMVFLLFKIIISVYINNRST